MPVGAIVEQGAIGVPAIEICGPFN